MFFVETIIVSYFKYTMIVGKKQGNKKTPNFWKMGAYDWNRHRNEPVFNKLLCSYSLAYIR